MSKRTFVIERLRAADRILAMAGRERPHGFKSPLSECRSYGELPGWKIAEAVEIMCVVTAMPDPAPQRAISLAMATDREGPLYTLPEIATMMGVSLSTTNRLLGAAVEFLKDRLPEAQIAA